VIVADTSAIIALIDGDDQHHAALVELYDADPDAWVLPWAILPEVDYLLASRVSAEAQRAFLRDLAAGSWPVEWGDEADLSRAHELNRRHRALEIGLVDAVVAALAERVRASAIATLDVRHFGVMQLKGLPRLLPRDR
jgi:uncharacterized protein